jgi:hypothetical protein
MVSPYPEGTCTPQEAPSFAWRTNGKAEPQRRVCGTNFLNKYTHKSKKPRYNERRRRCRLQRVLARLLDVDELLQSSAAYFLV